MGYLGYELKSETEGSMTIPDAQMFFVDRFCVIDHRDNKLFICALSNELTESAQLGWLRRMSQNISDIQPEPPTSSNTRSVRFNRAPHDRRIWSTFTKAWMRFVMERPMRVCLTTQWVGRPIDELALNAYRRLRTAHAVPFAAYLSMDSVKIGSVSPERFLKVDASGTVQAKPIKGTAARSSDPLADAQAADELRRSEKDQTENLMIVDLLRNDLGRVCRLGSVHVPHLMAIESYAVHQMVSTVEGSYALNAMSLTC